MTSLPIRYIDAQDPLPEGTLVLEHTHDVLALGAGVHALRSIALQFPQWSDGRAYSQAVLLRGRARFAGELIATGEVLADMLPLLRRCGFSAVQMRADQQIETAERALGLMHGPAKPRQATAAERAAGQAR